MQRLVDARRTLTDPGGCHAYYTTLRASRWGQSDMWYTTEGVQILEEIKRKKEVVKLARQAHDATARAAANDPFAEVEVPPSTADSLVLLVAIKGDRLRFRIGASTAFRSLMRSFCGLRGIDGRDVAHALETRFRFTYDGCAIAEADTPNSLQMEDGDQLDVEVYPE
jgi:hypothetical protein